MVITSTMNIMHCNDYSYLQDIVDRTAISSILDTSHTVNLIHAKCHKIANCSLAVMQASGAFNDVHHIQYSHSRPILSLHLIPCLIAIAFILFVHCIPYCQSSLQYLHLFVENGISIVFIVPVALVA